jgi:hypothetical protein
MQCNCDPQMSNDRHVLIPEFSLATDDWAALITAAETIVKLRRKRRLLDALEEIRGPSARKARETEIVEGVARELAMKWLKE